MVCNIEGDISMRTRTIVLVVAILLVAGFAALNWSEIVRPAPLLLGPVVMDAPLGLILLAVLAITLVLFLASTAAMRTQSLIDYRQHQKTLEAQRDLADKAEASRFVDLRQHLDTHLKEMRERDAIAASEFDKAMLQSRRELQTQMEQVNRTISARLNELEHRLEARLERAGIGRGPVVAPVRNDVVPAAAVHQPVPAQQVREAEIREEERLRDERIRAGREEPAAAADRPAETGWRRWF
jgi:D-ribose pyranose/furanose isomerase RbsD